MILQPRMNANGRVFLTANEREFTRMRMAGSEMAKRTKTFVFGSIMILRLAVIIRVHSRLFAVKITRVLEASVYLAFEYGRLQFSTAH
jgi:hypothetical protein